MIKQHERDLRDQEYNDVTTGDAARRLPSINPGYNEELTTNRAVEVRIANFGKSVDDEDSDSREFEERKKKIEEYLGTLDKKKREWEEKKIEHFRKLGKVYQLPGEIADKKKKSLMVNLAQMRIDPKNVFANGQIKTLSIAEDARQTPAEDKEDLQDKVVELRKEMTD